MLAQFDYLSTVSGGGYLGAFFTSCSCRAACGADRTRCRPRPTRTTRCSASRPGGSAPGVLAADPGRGAVAWLRENGRYLSPTGAGDNLYAAVLVLRNWLAIHYVIGSALLLLLAVLALGQYVAVGVSYGLGRYEMDLLHDARQAFNQEQCAIWWSALLWLPLGSALLFAVPPGLAYWLVYPRASDTQAAARFFSPGPIVAMLVAVLLLLAARWVVWLGPGLVLACLLAAAGALMLLAVLCCLLMLVPAPRTVSDYRVRATRALRSAVTLTLWLLALGIADTAARTTYLHAFMTASAWSVGVPVGVLAALVWLVRYSAGLRDEGKRDSADTPWRALVAHLPVSLMAGALAALLALLVYVMWSWLVLYVRWNGREPVDWLVYGNAYTGPVLTLLLLVSLLLAVVAGRFTGFLNLSTLQPFYAARLTRAYLGASNGERFAAHAGGQQRASASAWPSRCRATSSP